MSKCHSASVDMLSINAPPFIYLPDVCADLQPCKATHVISSLWLSCSRGVDMLASQGGWEENRRGGEKEIAERETERGVDSGGRKRKSKWDKDGMRVMEDWAEVLRSRGGGGRLLLFPARSADWGWFQGGLSFSRNTTTAPRQGQEGRRRPAPWIQCMLQNSGINAV